MSFENQLVAEADCSIINATSLPIHVENILKQIVLQNNSINELCVKENVPGRP